MCLGIVDSLLEKLTLGSYWFGYANHFEVVKEAPWLQNSQWGIPTQTFELSLRG
jgi:hypothetical protein